MDRTKFIETWSSKVMENIKAILFDCMETLVDMRELPSPSDYALWAFEGSGCENYWGSFQEFYNDYQCAKEDIVSVLPEFKEYNMVERFRYAAQRRLPNSPEEHIKQIVQMFLENYWHNYKSRCFVKDEVKDVLLYLKKKYRLGVVSNFMVSKGIEDLLEYNEIAYFFDIVITSINEGWRKPHPSIYYCAIDKLRFSPKEILFIGDDIICDYEGPKKIGLNAIFLNTKDNPNFQNDSIKSLSELKKIL